MKAKSHIETKGNLMLEAMNKAHALGFSELNNDRMSRSLKLIRRVEEKTFSDWFKIVKKWYDIRPTIKYTPKAYLNHKKDYKQKLDFTVIDIEVTKLSPETKEQLNTNKINHVYAIMTSNGKKTRGGYKANFATSINDCLLSRILPVLDGGLYYACNASGYENIFFVQTFEKLGYRQVKDKKECEKTAQSYYILPQTASRILHLCWNSGRGLVDLRDINRLTSSSMDGLLKNFTNLRKINPDEYYKCPLTKKFIPYKDKHGYGYYDKQRITEKDCDKLDHEYMRMDVEGVHLGITNFQNTFIDVLEYNPLLNLTIGSASKMIELIHLGEHYCNGMYNTLEVPREHLSGGQTFYSERNASKIHSIVLSTDYRAMYPSNQTKVKLPTGIGEKRQYTTTWGKLIKSYKKDKYYHISLKSGNYIYLSNVPTAFYVNRGTKTKPFSFTASENNYLYLQDFHLYDPDIFIDDNAEVEVWEHTSDVGIYKNLFVKLLSIKEIYGGIGAGYASKILSNANWGKVGENPNPRIYNLVNTNDKFLEISAECDENIRYYQSVAISSAITATNRFMISKLVEPLYEHFVIGDTDSAKYRGDTITIEEIKESYEKTVEHWGFKMGTLEFDDLKKRACEAIGVEFGGKKDKATGERILEAIKDNDKKVIFEEYVYNGMGKMVFEGYYKDFVAFQKKTYAHMGECDVNGNLFDKPSLHATMCGISTNDLIKAEILETYQLSELMKDGIEVERLKGTIVKDNGVVLEGQITQKGGNVEWTT